MASTKLRIHSSGHAVAVTEDDDIVFAEATRGVYIGVAGDLVATMANGEDCTFVGLLAGVVYPFQIIAVKEASTAASIVALF